MTFMLFDMKLNLHKYLQLFSSILYTMALPTTTATLALRKPVGDRNPSRQLLAGYTVAITIASCGVVWIALAPVERSKPLCF